VLASLVAPFQLTLRRLAAGTAARARCRPALPRPSQVRAEMPSQDGQGLAA